MMKNTFQASGTVLARADHLSNTKQGGVCCLYYIYFILTEAVLCHVIVIN